MPCGFSHQFLPICWPICRPTWILLKLVKYCHEIVGQDWLSFSYKYNQYFGQLNNYLIYPWEVPKMGYISIRFSQLKSCFLVFFQFPQKMTCVLNVGRSRYLNWPVPGIWSERLKTDRFCWWNDGLFILWIYWLSCTSFGSINPFRGLDGWRIFSFVNWPIKRVRSVIYQRSSVFATFKGARYNE